MPAAVSCLAVLLFALLPLPAAAEMRPIVVPPALLEVTAFPEPSGIVWCAALGKYLVATDDTGRKDRKTRHSPWLLAMDSDGRLDPNPVVVAGLEGLDDAEALAPGPDGNVYVLTSHSPEKDGRRPAARRVFAELRVREGRVLGAGIDLTSRLTAGGSSPDRMDFEGLAYRGAFLVAGSRGLAFPDAPAVLVRFSNPFAAHYGRSDKWGEVTLAVNTTDGVAHQGISDLCFLPDGSLVLLGKSPKGAKADGGGALWVVRRPPSGLKNPQLVRRFPGRKPEGVCLSRDGTSLIVVTDEDGAQPFFEQVPIP